MDKKNNQRRTSGIRRQSGEVLTKRVKKGDEEYTVEGRSRSEVMLEEKMLLEKLDSGGGEYITLNDFFKGWIERKMTLSDRTKEVTIYRYEQHYNNCIRESLGECRIIHIRRQDVIRLQVDLARNGVTAGTINYVIMLLRAILKDAVYLGVIERNPADSIAPLELEKREKAVTSIHRALTEKEQEEFMAVAEGSHYYEFIAMMLCTGMRQGECAALTWGDIDYRSNAILVSKTLSFRRNGEVIMGSAKTETSIRRIPMNATIRAILESQREKTRRMLGTKKIPREHVVFFPATDPNRFIHNATINEVLRRIQGQMRSEGMPIERFTSHALRDTFATRFIEQGGNPQNLKRLLGHASLKMTMDLYAQVLDAELHREMSSICINVGPVGCSRQKSYSRMTKAELMDELKSRFEDKTKPELIRELQRLDVMGEGE